MQREETLCKSLIPKVLFDNIYFYINMKKNLTLYSLKTSENSFSVARRA